MMWNGEESSTRLSIQTIPGEVRGMIFNFLPQNEVLNLQLVCKLWKKDVDQCYNYEIQLDERSPFFKQILQLRIKKLKIVQLIEHHITCPCYPDLMGVAFKYPNLIEELDVWDGVSINKCISGGNLQRLLQNSQASLKSLKIALFPMHLNHAFPPNIDYNFKNLRFITISITSKRYYESSCPDILKNGLLSQIANSECPNLQSLNILGSNDGSVQYSILFDLQLFKVLTINPTGLEHLMFNFKSNRQLNLLPNELALLRKILNLKRLSLNVVLSRQQDVDFGSVLISNQTKIEMLNTLRLFEFPIALFQSMLSNNYKTIIAVWVESLDLRTGELLDVSNFKKCATLVHINLRRGKSESRVNLGVEDDSPHLVNLTDLPPYISSLKLTDFNITTQDIFNLFNSDVINTLRELVLINCGISGGLGMSSEIVEEILTLEYSELNIIILQGFNLTDPEERERLNELFIRLGHPGVDLLPLFHLEFSRDTDNHFVTKIILGSFVRD